ncbi:hypothetical protein LCGC14_1307820 [marine sediment metagenome]|uniref:Glycosyltransferase 2-like domain-containing protein n=1 Tax=marine sediment metagenome TaxID=412755 RepID=A0A0F9NQP2_9ZZZZ
MKKVAILPAYNLSKSIDKIVERTSKFVDVVIVVSDGSTDDTNLAASEAGAICPPHSNNRGKGYAIRKGIRFSMKFNPKYIILIDADGQHLPEEIPNMLRPIINNLADMVVGSRIRGNLKTSAINKVGNLFLKIISLIMTGRWFSDTESGFRAFKAEMLYKLNLEAVFYEIETELLYKALKKGFKVVEIPITVPKAIPGITIKDGIKVGIYKIITGVKLRFER